MISGLFAAAISCTAILDDAEYAEDIKLGAKEKAVECPLEYGECSFEVVANCKWSARIISGAEWLAFSGSDMKEIQNEGNATLSLSYTSNNGYRRRGLVVLSSGQRHDTLSVKQVGSYRQIVEAETKAISVPGEGGRYDIAISTNLIKKDFRFETVDSKGFPVIGKTADCTFEDNIFSFRVLESDSRDEKTFIVRIYAVDAWEEKISADITITQKPGRK